MYGGGCINVLKGVVELSIRPPSCLELQEEWLVLLSDVSLWDRIEELPH